jgi:hypothetical protein
MTPFKPQRQYTTRSGRTAVIHAFYPQQDRPLMGAIYDAHLRQWVSSQWFADGKCWPTTIATHCFDDLIAPETHKHTVKVWLLIHHQTDGDLYIDGYASEERAKESLGDYGHNVRDLYALISQEITYTVGEGL